MKKRIIFIILIVVFLAGITGGIFLFKNNQNKKIEQEKIENITALYSNYTNGKKLDCDTSLCSALNSNIEVHEKINSLKDYNISINEIKSLDTTVDEINNLKSEISNLKFSTIDNYLDSMDEIEKKTFTDIYDNSVITSNITTDEEILKNYLNSLEKHLDILNYFKTNQKKYKIENNKIIYNDDDFKKYVDTLNLNITLEKEVKEETKKVTQNEVKPSGKRIPILMYHAVDYDVWGAASLFVNPDNFKSQMEYLHEQGFTTLFLSDIGSASSVNKPIIITFDDGYKDMYDVAYPIMRDLNIKSNMYIISGWLDGQTYMNPDMVKELSNSGLVEIGSHTVSHVYLASKGYDEQERQLKESKEYLENLLGKEIDTIAYPYGSYNSNTLTIAKKYYKYAVTTSSGANYSGSYSNSTLTLKRYNIQNTTGIETFKKIVNGG